MAELTVILEKTAECFEVEVDMAETAEHSKTIEKVEDLFTDEW